MSLTPVVELALLRAWGFQLWDPLCIAGTAGREDAYDRWLLGAFGRVRSGQTEGEVVAYLVEIELEELGRRGGSGAGFRAGALVKSLAEYAASLPPGAVRVEWSDGVAG